MRSANITPSSLWDREQAFIRHKKRLKHIKSHHSTRLDNSPPTTQNLVPPIQRAHIFLDLEHSKAIQKDNDELLQRLNCISNRKPKYCIYNDLQSPIKSLNFPARKKEAERIFFENFAFLKRITGKSPSLSVKKFDEEYEQSRKYKKTLSRISHIERAASLGKTGLLPPIAEDGTQTRTTQEKFNPKKKSLSMNEIEIQEITKNFKKAHENPIKTTNLSDREIEESDNRNKN
ncbi:unnamed protein product [Blepharisma stoltei]|uniref:Uncharacterized protein n=1 Tax=Blepharisma stoltei TaxID=1481888 RepID=A0AAU9KI06_9CILI|nr:unnamed protein product [Blepharisma stoltei]